MERVLRQRKPKGNQEWTFESHRQHWAHETQDEDKQNTQTQHNTEKMSNTDSTQILAAPHFRPGSYAPE